jgi:hypothetical protein
MAWTRISGGNRLTYSRARQLPHMCCACGYGVGMAFGETVAGSGRSLNGLCDILEDAPKRNDPGRDRGCIETVPRF